MPSSALMLPIILAHLIVPPLSYLEVTDEHSSAETEPKKWRRTVFNWLYSYLPKEMKDSSFVSSLLLNKYDEEHCCLTIQHISHIFVHHNYDHMFQNCLSSVVNGQKVLQAKGWAFMYFIYLGGGIFSRLPIENILNQVDPENIVIEDICKTVKHYTTNIFSSLGIQCKSMTCGSSAASFALLGSSVVLAMQSVIDRIQSWSMGGNSNKLAMRDFFSISMNITTILVGCHSLGKQWADSRARDVKEIPSFGFLSTLFPELVQIESSPSDPMVNMKGFVFGATATIMSWWLGK